MINFKSLLMTALLASAPALAQNNAAAPADIYPEVCKAEAAHAAHGAPAAQPESDLSAMNEHQRASMPAMTAMNENMMQGMMKEDADVAFVCGMIAHHQGAIDMANLQLEHGDDEQMKQLARKIIADQQREIAEMTDWLAVNAE